MDKTPEFRSYAWKSLKNRSIRHPPPFHLFGKFSQLLLFVLNPQTGIFHHSARPTTKRKSEIAAHASDEKEGR
jgi:hypothetical protein